MFFCAKMIMFILFLVFCSVSARIWLDNDPCTIGNDGANYSKNYSNFQSLTYWYLHSTYQFTTREGRIPLRDSFYDPTKLDGFVQPPMYVEGAPKKKQMAWFDWKAPQTEDQAPCWVSKFQNRYYQNVYVNPEPTWYLFGYCRFVYCPGGRTWAQCKEQRKTLYSCYANMRSFYAFVDSHAFTRTNFYDGCLANHSVYSRLKVHSILHTAGDPYMVPCLSCSPNAARTGLPKAFWFINNRDPFKKFSKIKEHFSEGGTDGPRRSTVASQMYYWLIGRIMFGSSDSHFSRGSLSSEVKSNIKIPYSMAQRQQAQPNQIYKSTMVYSRFLFMAQRLWQPLISGTYSAGNNQPIDFVRPQGKLFVDPDPEGLGEFLYFWNAATYACVEQIDMKEGSDGPNLRTPQVIVNVDTLARPKWIDQESSEDSSQASFDYWRIGHIIPSSMMGEFKRVRLEDFNLMLDLHWENWSPCTACCCSTIIECGDASAILTEQQCERVKSFKRRRGYGVIKKIDINKAIVFKSSLMRPKDQYEQWLLLEKWLSTSPYREEGIPCFSTLINNHRMKDVFKDLSKQLFEEYYRELETKKSFGLYIDVKQCTKKEKQCKNWERAFKLFKESKEIDEDPVDVKEVIEKRPPSTYGKRKPCDHVSFNDIYLSNDSQSADVTVGRNYRIVFVLKGNETGVVAWKQGKKSVAKYNEEFSCSEQKTNPFRGPMGKDLMLLYVKKKMVARPFIGTLIQGSQEMESRKIMLKFNQGVTDTESTKKLFMWLGIVLGVLAVFAIFAGLVYVFGSRKKKVKKAK